ncbi:uncharacterized protein LOC126811148 [Patella vulgata]|uniref:uncharacterized protein LOC126811148 n=1 Tax=Patella vulgata TaxID=6465 RepID=UPI0024A8BF33|nr:uncharacterized protein LOC126811148 [Patella vulgata]
MWKVIFCLLFSVFCCSHIVVGERSSHSRMSDYKTIQSNGSPAHAAYVKVVDKSSSNNFNHQASPYSDSPTSKESVNEDKLTGKAYYNGVSKGIADQEFYSQTLLDQSQRLSLQTENSKRQAQQASSKQTTTPFPFKNRVTRPPDRRECTDCVLNGVTYKGHSRFEYQEDCLHHRCICHCDGSWDCPAGSVIDMCERESMNNPKCRTCDVQDQQITGNSYFDMTEGCIMYSNCICRCNGSWECSDDRSENICAAVETTKTPTVTDCQKCFAHGLYRRGNSRFSHTDDCFEYDCDCFCDGQWECPSGRAQNICDYEDESPPGCSECEVNGEFFEGNSKFKQTTGCTEKTCDCHCDGTYDCPAHMMKNICNKNETRKCSRCEVSETESYPGDSKFTLSKECIHYDCTCNCDGSWSCPGKDARNLCKGERPGGCRNCEISDKEFYNGNTNFTLQKGCIGYNCVCNCDGSWNCPGEDARDTCKGETIGGCKSCILSDREYYPGDTDFEMKQGCILYQCRCNCDGGWNCPGYKAKDICQNPEAENDRRLETCKACKLSNGERYEPNTKFLLERGCYQYECNCNCDGLYDCPDKSATNICDVSPEDKEEFRARQEKEFQRQRLREQELMREQQRKEAFERQRRREQEIREARQRYRIEQTRKEVTSTQRVSSRSEEDSLERDEQERRGREREKQERNEEAKKEKLRYEMERERQMRLQQEKILQAKLQRERQERDRVQRERTRTTDKTRDETRRETRVSNKHDRTDHAGMEMIPNVNPYNSQPCLKCSFAGETHPGNTEFEYKRGCYTYQCTCDCNGRWKCDRNNVIYTCDKSRTEDNVRRTTNSRTIANQHSSPTYVVKTERKPQTVHRNVQRSREAGSAYSSTSSASASFSSQSSINTPTRKYSPPQRRQYQTPEVSRHKIETHTRENKPSVSRETGSQGMETTNTKYQVSQESGDRYQSATNTNYPFFPRETSHNVQSTRRVIYPSSQTGYQQVHSSGFYKNPFLSPRVNSHQSPRTNYHTVPLPSGNNYPSPQGVGYTVQTSTRYIFPAAHRVGTHSASTSSNFPIRQTHPLPVGGSVYPTAPVGSVNADSCQVCLADDKNYNVNDLFDMNRDCVIYKCRCLCNGNYRCAITPNPTCNERSVETQCGNCHIHGLIYPGNMGFQQKRGCYEYTCQCKCDGTYECPDEKKVNLCPSNDPALTDPYNAQRDCGTCTIEGNFYTGNSQFKIYEKCLVYSCDCNCLGIWKCSAEHAPGCLSANGGVTVGYPTFNTTGSCSECLVNKQPHSANLDFKLKQGCLEYACRCNCDGTWYCPTQSPKHLCDASAIQRQAISCQSCDVRGTIYPADATFVLREGCHQHTCVCNCDGTWRCPNNSTINVCESSTRTVNEKSSCKECAVNGITYMSNSDFEFREGCSQYNCKCFCNGSWECPPDKTENMCRSPDYRIDGCRECLVNNQSYPGGSPFNYREGCWRFNCMCSCDGKWSCPPGRSVDICEKVASVSSRCRPCVIESKVIKSKSTFNLRQGCTEYLCDCECNGNWTCPVDRSINTCELGGIKDSPDKTADKQTPRGCEVGNKTYFTRLFGYTEQCIQYTCICYDNGAWRCPPNRSRKVC